MINTYSPIMSGGGVSSSGKIPNTPIEITELFSAFYIDQRPYFGTSLPVMSIPTTTKLNYAFTNCHNITSITLQNTDRCTSIRYMCIRDENLRSLPSGLNWNVITDASGAFEATGITQLPSIDFTFPALQDASSLFAAGNITASKPSDLHYPKFPPNQIIRFPRATNARWMFGAAPTIGPLRIYFMPTANIGGICNHIKNGWPYIWPSSICELEIHTTPLADGTEPPFIGIADRSFFRCTALRKFPFSNPDTYPPDGGGSAVDTFTECPNLQLTTAQKAKWGFS